MAEIKVLALDLDGTLTNDQKEVTPRTRAALDAAIERGVTVVLASGRPTAGITPLAKDLGLDKKGGCILSYNGGKIVDCRTGETLVEKTLDPALVPELCAFAAAQDVAILTYNSEGVVCERDQGRVGQQGVLHHQAADDPCGRPCLLCGLPDLQDAHRAGPRPAGRRLCRRQRSSLRAGPTCTPPARSSSRPCRWAWPRTASLAALLERMGLTRENLMACGDGLNDRSMIAYAGRGRGHAERRGCRSRTAADLRDRRRQQPRRRGRGRGEVYPELRGTQTTMPRNLVLFDLEWNIGYQPYTL